MAGFRMNGWSGYQNSPVKHKIGKHPSKKDGHIRADHKEIKQNKKDARKEKRKAKTKNWREVRPLYFDMD